MNVRIKGNNPIFDLSVENNAIKPISESFSILGGQPHSNGGTDIFYNGQWVEAQKGEPLSKNDNGDVVAWGKMKNPITNNLFETDAKLLAKDENTISKLQKKADSLMPSTVSSDMNGLAYNTASVIQDAINIKQKNLDFKKQYFSDIQQNILDMADYIGADPNKFSKTLAKNGATIRSGKVKVKIKGLPKMQNGGQFDNYLQYDEDLRNYLNQNPNLFVTDGIQPRDKLYGQHVNGVGYGDYYNQPLNNINAIRALQGQSSFDVSTPKGVKDYQSWYNQQFKDYTGRNYYTGTDDPIGIDSKYGNKTSSHLLTQGHFKGLQNKTLTADQINQMSDSDFKAISGMSKSDFFKSNQQTPGINIMGRYNFDAPIAPLPDASVPSNPVITAQPRPINQLPAQNPYIPQEAKKLPSLADRNKLGLANFLPEIAAIFEKPTYVEGQQYNPELYSPYSVSFQDRINQNQADFNRVAQSLKDNPAALATLAGQLRQANDQVYGEQFRVNQGIANQVNNQNIGILNDARLKNIQLNDEKYLRQEQARANTKENRDRALQSISNKFLQNKAENNTIRMIENLSNYRLNENLQAQNYNEAPVINWHGMTNDEWNKMSDAQKSEFLQQQQDMIKKKQQAQNVTKKFGGLF